MLAFGAALAKVVALAGLLSWATLAHRARERSRAAARAVDRAERAAEHAARAAVAVEHACERAAEMGRLVGVIEQRTLADRREATTAERAAVERAREVAAAACARAVRLAREGVA